MHVLQLMSSRGRGGLEQVCLDYTRLLVGRGHAVSLFLQPDSPMCDAIAAAGGRVCTDGLVFRPGARWLPGRLARWRAFVGAPPEVVLLHNARGVGNLRAITKAPLIGVCHNANFTGRLDLDGAICVSRGIRDALAAACERARRPMPPAAIVPNMLPFDAPPPPMPQRFAGETVVIGTMARFVRKKGVDRLIRAVAALRARGLAVTCVIAGEGEEGPALRALAAELGLGEAVRFVGWVEDKAAFFAGIDVFCLPSRSESFGIALAEAMYFGCPALSTDCDGPRDIADGGNVAVLYDRNSETALAEALARVIADPGAARAMAARGQALVLARYMPARVAEALEGVAGGALKSVAVNCGAA